ncbi:tyrosine-type recombinase/integrase [Paenibacillus allorhizosphaerae]|uniref:Tyrosine recombinase XerC n=1 Tax=Paenibacillus allorhizosphaerae TaxID=2849866 RepID=A0ABN7TYG7_9BACL|nr:tyrosine-type recombinase/integrase [Paenibacillus allorhizosphaerae]CAG7657066.1 Tyrosine recombinase XerC [Paenibacillus allorhizosphaerae]
MEGVKNQYSEQWIEPFTDYLREKGKEESTVKLYAAEIGHFLDWLKRSDKSMASVVQEDIFASRDELYIQGKRLSTINKYVSILASFFKWAEERGMAKGNPAASARYYTPKKNELPRWLTAEEEASLLALAEQEKNPFKRSRNLALLYVLLNMGLRLEEVSELQVSSVLPDELIVYDRGTELRRVPMDSKTYACLSEWIEQRALASKECYKTSMHLFVTERSGYMQPRAVQFVIEGYAEKLGFEISCHDLRNTFCRRLAEQGTPILLLKRWAGHKSFLTSYQYYSGLK